MTKLEELSVFLVNEISDLKRNVDKLEKINTQLKDTKIKMDLTEYKSIIETHQQKMELFVFTKKTTIILGRKLVRI